MRTVPLLALTLAALALGGCPKKDAPASGSERADATGGGDDIVPVYDAAAAPSAPALALCTAMHGLPATRKAACCAAGAGASPVVQPCAGALTSAIALKDVTLDDARAKACADARAAQLEGCGWVGTFAPPVPDACRDVVAGALDEGARCRSSLACKAGLRCHGASLLDAGRCGKPGKPGARCGASVDALAVVTGQPEVDRAHPECEGACVLGRCAPLAKAGDACHADAACGDGNRCEAVAGAAPGPGGGTAGAKVCVAGRIAIGGACTAGGCVEGARCVAGACAAKSDEGGPCASDLDCARGGCVEGKCAMKCAVN